MYTGNEIGSLLGWWQLQVHRKEEKRGIHVQDPTGIYFVASTVSSKMLKSIAIKEGLGFEVNLQVLNLYYTRIFNSVFLLLQETLTGFKWMANKAVELESSPAIGGGRNKVLLAFEEAIGFMCGTTVLDKDGISAAVRAAELMAYLQTKENGKTLSGKLTELYQEYEKISTEQLAHDQCQSVFYPALFIIQVRLPLRNHPVLHRA